MEGRTKYVNRFIAHVYVRLGGLDMANEFFTLHPQLMRVMKGQAIYHFNKGGAVRKAAWIFFRRIIRPQLHADRDAVTAGGKGSRRF